MGQVSCPQEKFPEFIEIIIQEICKILSESFQGDIFHVLSFSTRAIIQNIYIECMTEDTILFTHWMALYVATFIDRDRICPSSMKEMTITEGQRKKMAEYEEKVKASFEEFMKDHVEVG